MELQQYTLLNRYFAKIRIIAYEDRSSAESEGNKDNKELHFKTRC